MIKYQIKFSITRRGPVFKDDMQTRIQKYERTLKRRYARAKHRAKKAKRAFTLTFAQYESLLIDDMCTYCGGRLDKTGSSLDRINSRYGYTKKNSVACCGVCNMMKSNLTMEQFFKQVQRIIKYVKL